MSLNGKIIKKATACFVFGLILLLGNACYFENEVFNPEPDEFLGLPGVLKFNGTKLAFDNEMLLLRYPVTEDTISAFSPFVEFKENAGLEINGKKISNQQKNNLGKITTSCAYNVTYTIAGKTYHLNLVFTRLPIIKITCDSEIHDEPKTLAGIEVLNSDASSVFSSFAGIEIRGKHSRDYPKQSLGFELWKNMSDDKIQSTPLLGFRNNSNWILNGAVIDPSRIRNLVSFQLWNSLFEGKYMGIESRPVELFINHDFRGLYIFSELLNAELLDAGAETVLYKGVDWENGAVTFETFDPELSENQFWNGWEQKIPDRKERINWKPLFELYKLIINGSDKQFSAEIANLIDLENLIDYYLFLNLVKAPDNTGKNIFLWKQNMGAKFQIIPWDLDGSWGIVFDGTRINHTGILTNNLYERLFQLNPNLFKEEVKIRWLFLRQNVFHEQNIFHVFNSWFQFLEGTDLIQYENQVWILQLDIISEQN